QLSLLRLVIQEETIQMDASSDTGYTSETPHSTREAVSCEQAAESSPHAHSAGDKNEFEHRGGGNLQSAAQNIIAVRMPNLTPEDMRTHEQVSDPVLILGNFRNIC
ncbi:hypothetical protein PMAYCL1PPCAC_08450, partial [Pristionchus mayeri]